MSTTVVLNVPAGDGVGTSSDVSMLGSAKTFVVNGTVTPGEIFVVEASGDPTGTPENSRTYLGVVQFNSDSPAAIPVDNVANRFRVRRLNSGPGTPSVTVSAEDTGTQNFAAIAVPLITAPAGGTAVGAATNISTFGDEISIYLGGAFQAGGVETLAVEGSQDNITWDGIVAVNNGYAGIPFRRAAYNFLRIRRSGPPSNGVVLTANVATSTSGAGGGAFPGYGSPVQNWVKLTDGTLLTVARADHKHTQFPSPESFVVACIDDATGDDTTALPGYSEALVTPAATMTAALAAAVLTPFKTPERLGQLLPRQGNNATLVVLVKPRAGGAVYRNIANTANADMSWASELVGWKRTLIRGSLDFVNNTNDKITAGFQVVATTNAAGYSCGAGSTTSSLVNILTAAGAPPALPAQVNGQNAITMKRCRFLATTPTVALQNATFGLWYNGTDSIIPSDNLPAVPAFIGPGDPGNDVFVIEEPGWAMGDGSMSAPQASSGILVGGAAIGSATTVVGSRFISGNQIISGPGAVCIAGCENTAGLFAPSDMTAFRCERTYPDEVGTSIAVGIGMRAATGFQPLNVNALSWKSSADLRRTSTGWFGTQRFDAGAGSFLGHGFQHDSSQVTNPTMANSNGAGKRIGNTGSATARRLRISTPNAGVPGVECVSALQIRGVDISGVTGACIVLRGTQAISVDDVVSTDGGNTDVVLDLSGGYDGNVAWGVIAANTIAATLGDVRFAGRPSNVVAAAVFNTLSSTDMWDSNRNHLQGTGKSLIEPGTSVGIQVTGVAIPAFRVVTSLAAIADYNIVASDASVANSGSPYGVTLTASTATIGSTQLVTHTGLALVEFDVGPVPGEDAYVSATNPGFATTTPPARRFRLGPVIAVVGGLGLVALQLNGTTTAPLLKFSGWPTLAEGAIAIPDRGGLLGAENLAVETGYVPPPCKVRGFRVNVLANTATVATTVAVYKNGVITGISTAYGAGATGIQSELATTVSFNGTTDTLDVKVSAGDGAMKLAATLQTL